jgi:DNA-binding NarL/FixJ family response regulator
MSSKDKINIAVVDDQQLFRQGLISLLRETRNLNILFEAENGIDLLEKLKSVKNLPDVILLDIEMPELDGVETTIRLKLKYPDIKIIILTMHDEEEMIVHLIEKGAHGFLPKNEDIESVVDAIFSVHQNGYFFNDRISKAMVKGLVNSKKIKPTFTDADLNERELEIIRLLCKEHTSPEIGKMMHLSTKTIHNYRLELTKKLGVRNTIGLVMYAVKKGLT